MLKIKVKRNRTITVRLDHVINVDDLAWAVIWQRFVQENPAKLSRWQIWKWAIDNIVEGRLYESHKMSEAARFHMDRAMRLVHEHYPEFSDS
jgi:hypothetical protein